MMKKYRFNILLMTLLLLLLIYPFLEHFQLVGLTYLLNVFTTIILISSVHAVSESRRQLVLALSIIVPAIVLGWGRELFQFEMSQVGATIMQIIAFGFIAYNILGYALRGGRVDAEKVAAAVCVYLLLGVVWQELYVLVDILIPGSFNAEALSGRDFLYYSFITLSTLGYGDITPANGPAQALAYTEALVGQLYLTILVARLVGLYIANAGSDGAGDT
ncbi:MAG: two pore domain potassium channel family protein [Desulfobacteraceae bacterium]|nr:two pore domain potassium channel family protein [Desulfobacteraceae bacterium]MBC2752393.1 two pore domain potassium channel family protein [Desulfobacteraceae bacterium]